MKKKKKKQNVNGLKSNIKLKCNDHEHYVTTFKM